jgi:trimeric autotransporter adhesin
MKKFYQYLTLLLCVYTQASHAQMGVNSTGAAPASSAMLDVSSTNKGLLIPRVALTSTGSDAPIGGFIVTSMLVYNTATAGSLPNNVVPGYYYWGPGWIALGTGSNGANWNVSGNAGTIAGTNFIGTTDNIPLSFRVNNINAGKIDPILFNSFYGLRAGNSTSTGSGNAAFGSEALSTNVAGNRATAFGFGAMQYANNTATTFLNTNLAVGYEALKGSITAAANTGLNNTAIGYLTLNVNTSGSDNTTNGSGTLVVNTTGNRNTAIGTDALTANVAGSNATAIGYGAMYNANNTATPFTNTNVALGYEALRGGNSGITGLANTALGYQTLFNNLTGSGNTATGNLALYSNTAGNENTANGTGTLYSNVAGFGATAIGFNAMQNTNNTATPFFNSNVAVGYSALKGSVVSSANTGTNNTAIGTNTLVFNSSGHSNAALGASVLTANTTGYYNTALGVSVLIANTTGNLNTAVGVDALGNNVAGNGATAIGSGAMKNTNNTATPFTNTNVAVGNSALRGSISPANNTGLSNTSIGYNTMLDNTSGSYNTAMGYVALNLNTTGSGNVAIGNFTLLNNVAGNNATAIGNEAMFYANNNATTFENANVAVGYQALKGSAFPANNTGDGNVAMGYRAIRTNTTGNGNVAIGNVALTKNTTGSFNTTVGVAALYNNTTGYDNTAIGENVLYNNTTGYDNTAIGDNVLNSNVAGKFATAIGSYAMYYANSTATLYDNTNVAVGFESLRGSTNAALNTGFSNTALGYQTLRVNVNGDYNTAIGLTALAVNTTGDRNTALGTQTLNNNTGGNSNTAVGTNALLWKTGGDNNTALGDEAGVGAPGVAFTNCTFIGANSSATVARTNVIMLGAGITNAQNTGDNQVLLGNTSVSQIRAQVTSITAYSDVRFKSNISDNIPGLSFITKLKPVTYNQNPEILHRIWGTSEKEVAKMDFSGIKKERFIGFLAQDVEKAANDCGFTFPGIEAPKNDKEVYSLRYVDFIMPMVKAIQEQQIIIEEKSSRITQLEEKLQKMADLEARLNITEASLSIKKINQEAKAEK